MDLAEQQRVHLPANAFRSMAVADSTAASAGGVCWEGEGVVDPANPRLMGSS
ncbi:hypothetical protein [Mycolicibacterium goodii]|uniref:hypothetical protein n=1 Tax=Mycolicibacterium goodii TaxID=134601 RepID=UPI000A463B87